VPSRKCLVGENGTGGKVEWNREVGNRKKVEWNKGERNREKGRMEQV